MKIMKHIITLFLVLLFASCEQMKTKQEYIEDDPNVFVFEGNCTSVGFEKLDEVDISFNYNSKITFTISDEDNCIYYIYEEGYDLKGFEYSYSTKPHIKSLSLIDKIGNSIFTFDPITKTPSVRAKKSTHTGKVPESKDVSLNLTRSKLERTKHTNVYFEWRLND